MKRNLTPKVISNKQHASKKPKKSLKTIISIAAATVLAGLIVSFIPHTSAQKQSSVEKRFTAGTEKPVMSELVKRQISELRADKMARTTAQQKISSQLIYAARMNRGESITPSLPKLRNNIKLDVNQKALVNIIARDKQQVLNKLAGLADRVGKQAAPEIAKSFENKIYARIRLDQLEEIAGWENVVAIRQTMRAMHNSSGPLTLRQNGTLLPTNPLLNMVLPKSSWTGFEGSKAQTSDTAVRNAMKRQTVQEKLAPVLNKNQMSPAMFAANVSEGDKTHKADVARTLYGVNGTGVKIGVLSDGVDSLAALQASGDLGAVTVLPGQAGSGDEGSAMLEIVHDLAPGAQLFFATADDGVNGEDGFAANILALKAQGCNVIIDDIIYLDESPFHEGTPVQLAVNTVTAGGALYFSSAGNEGNKDDLTSGTWEGDFKASAAADPAMLAGANLHDFGDGGNSILVEFGGGNPPLLNWAEFYNGTTGFASTDFDLYDMNGSLTMLFDASTDTQNGAGGDDFPIEYIGGGTFGGERLLIDKFAAGTTSSVPMMHLEVFRGELDDNRATNGSTFGHSSSADAFSVAATPAKDSFDGITPDGPYPNPFTAANKSESFTNDGPRRLLLSTTGVEFTPGNRTSTGGIVRQKPDITAADGVSCAAPGFNPFYGTSASAPHAGAIAALIISGNQALTTAAIRTALISSAIDIEAAGTDRDTGAGIVMADAALQAAGIPLAPTDADIAVTKLDSPDPVIPGNNIAYAITVTNNGPTTGNTLTLTDNTPANTTFQSITAPAGWACTTPAVGGTGPVSCTAASLANGASAAFSLVVNVNTGAANGTITNTASASSTNPDPTPANNSATATTTVAEFTSPPPTGLPTKALLVKPSAGNTTAGGGSSDSSCVAPTGVTVAGVFANINQALGAAAVGDTIYVCPKYTANLVVPYVEHVSLGFTNLSVVGISDVRGSRAVIAANPSTATTPTTQLGTNYVVQIVATGVNFGNFVVDGAPGGTNFTGTGIFNGIAVRRSGAFVFNNTVQNIRTGDLAVNADGQGIAVFGAGTAGTPIEAGTAANPVNVLNNVVQTYRSNGINVSAGSSSAYAFVRGNYVIGNGANSGTTNQSGIQLQAGANGDVFNNRVTRILDSVAGCSAAAFSTCSAGIRLNTTSSSSTGSLRVRFNLISNTQTGIFAQNIQFVSIVSNTISHSVIDGINLRGSISTLGSNFNTINQNTIFSARRSGVFLGLVGGDASLGNTLTQNTIDDAFTGVANNPPSTNNVIQTTGATANAFISVTNLVSSASSGVNDVQNTNPLP